jgi:predicted ATPase
VLRRLDRAAVAQVAADVLGGPPGDDLLALAYSAQGNPFFLMELLAGLRDEGLAVARGGRVTLREARLPGRVHDNMQRRLSRLSPLARRTAAVAASMGRRFTMAGLAAERGAGPAELAGQR